jgi:acyl-CoA dehydrogenase family member 9
MAIEDLKLKNVSARDKDMIRDIEAMMGPEPSTMGFAKNLFWGRLEQHYVFPYPTSSEEETRKCDELLANLEAYLKNEHPSILIDREEYIPEWAIKRLFELGVMGMTVPEEYGGLGLGITSYNRALEMIGSHCGSTAVMVSAHQSIGCKAIMLFGSEEQKREFLPKVAREYLSAFCLSEPNVGSDAAGQETRCVKSEDGSHFILNGEKKWSTSGALSGMFTVMTKQRMVHPATGAESDRITALICTPDMEGVEIFEKNRSKACIRGTWQARVRFSNVKVPIENLLHEEGRGLNVALTCLNFGRCTLSAGVTGAAKRAADQSIKWVQTRYQFDRPLADFELVQERIARMSAFTFALDATLYLMTGMLDRHDRDIMVETAITKIFCSQIGWEVIDDAVQIMGGEAFVTENEIERLWRDNRIHRVVEGSNEVMQPFVFGYGGKQLAEQMIGLSEALSWDSDESAADNISRILKGAVNPLLLKRALPLLLQLYLGKRPAAPAVANVHPALREQADMLSRMVQQHSHFFKMASKWFKEEIITRQVVQARIADNAMYLFALAASLARMDHLMRSGASGLEFDRDRAAFRHVFELFDVRMRQNITSLRDNADGSLQEASQAARKYNDALPNSDFYIHEASPIAKGTGKPIQTEHIRQFPGGAPGTEAGASGDGHRGTPAVKPSGVRAGRKRSGAAD